MGDVELLVLYLLINLRQLAFIALAEAFDLVQEQTLIILEFLLDRHPRLVFCLNITWPYQGVRHLLVRQVSRTVKLPVSITRSTRPVLAHRSIHCTPRLGDHIWDHNFRGGSSSSCDFICSTILHLLIKDLGELRLRYDRICKVW